MKIKSAQVGHRPASIFDPPPAVVVTFEDGTSKNLFVFYPDEISFSPEEFVGLTEEEAFSLRHKKDVDYLRS